ncbi:hypothetical protein L1887_48409 [Cichorium endivia]|nr:hypothetical protein L1887_48409 [Cichorium endivia]
MCQMSAARGSDGFDAHRSMRLEHDGYAGPSQLDANPHGPAELDGSLRPSLLARSGCTIPNPFSEAASEKAKSVRPSVVTMCLVKILVSGPLGIAGPHVTGRAHRERKMPQKDRLAHRSVVQKACGVEAGRNVP